jgi:Flp pilus assembly pilin Flp
MSEILGKLLREEEGATALEYALLVVLIAIVMSLGALFFGNALGNLFTKVGGEVDSVGPGDIPDGTRTY